MSKWYLAIGVTPGTIDIPKEGELTFHAEKCGDEYHSLDELYDHRMALNAALFNYLHGMQLFLEHNGYQKQDSWVVKSKLHNDGTMFEGGYFIVAAIVNGKQISYRYNLEHWDKFKIPEVERVPFEYDGHTSHDVIERLLKL